MIRSGVILNERYEVLERIGTGGMAEVYRGKDLKLNRMIAIKVLKKEFREDQSFIKKFTVEAQAAAGLMHPNVVNVYDVGDDRGLYFMVMELVEGITLKEYIEKKGRLTSNEVISIAIQMCLGIEAAHAQHIIHRDIKPQNIIISKEGKVKVTDFGIARVASSNTVNTSAMGSVHYTSPEQARGGYSDEKSDVYSVGVSIYEMITGVVPFDGDSTVAIALRHLQEDVVPPSEHVGGVPYSLEQIILKCMQKSQDRRYQNITALIADLKRSLVEPNGRFVGMSQGTDTVMITAEELNRIQNGYDEDSYDEDSYDEDSYDEENYDDDYDDEDYDEEHYDDDDEDDGRSKKKNSEVNASTAKVMKILAIVIAVIIVFVGVIFVGKAVGLFKAKPTTEEVDTTKVVVPEVIGQEEKVAETMLDKKGLKMEVTERKESTKYKVGQIISQSVEKDSKVKKGTIIQVVVCSKQTQEEVAVPSLAGEDETTAQARMKEAGLVITWEYSYDSAVASGLVISSNPAVGTNVAKGSSVTVVVSKGEETVSVPAVKGLQQAEAEKKLGEAGLSVGTVTQKESNDEAGIVISQGISSGTSLAKGSKIDLVVSSGPKEEQVTVPPVVNKAEATAVSLINNAGLVPAKEYKYHDTVKAGYVISCSPGENSSVKAGSTITIVISQGPEDKKPTDDPSQGEIEQ